MAAVPERTGVAIVGAGPAGLVLAHLLGQASIPFVVVERQDDASLGRHPKAGLIEYRTVQQLRQAGIAGSVLDFIVRNHQCEFRTPAGSAMLDYGALTGGRSHYLYPQHQLVRRLADHLVAGGGQVRFGYTVQRVSAGPAGAVVTVTGPGGRHSEIGCEVVVGCDGARSTVAAAMPGLRVAARALPVRWLSVVAQAPPLAGHTVYGSHPRGFAGQMRRGPAQTRYYLEVPLSDTLAAWPKQRIRDELSVRLLVPGRLGHGPPFGDVGCLDLRVRTAEPMQQGRLFLAGDAAHLITPAGGKGMNLAIQDAIELGGGLAERFGPGRDGARLAAYSATRLPAIWRAQAFSDWFLRIILAGAGDAGLGRDAGLGGEAGLGRDAGLSRESVAGEPCGFGRGLREGWVSALASDPLLARWFAHAYAGVDP